MVSFRNQDVSRRDVLKAAVAIGGAAALAACQSRESPDLPTGPDDPSILPTRQHAWNDTLPTDEHGNPIVPSHRVLLLLTLPDSGPPTAAQRETVREALTGVERAYPRHADGLFVSMSYAPAYFQRFDDPLPESVDLPEPDAMAPFEDPAFDEPDALVHLASHHGSVVLGAEELLRGELSTLNGVEVEAALTEVFDVADRRTGFVGAGLPANHQDVDGVPDGDHVPDESPLYMGFKSGFVKNQASEDRVTIEAGPFAGGTTQHLSIVAAPRPVVRAG